MFESNKVSDDGQWFYIYPILNEEKGHEGALPLHVFGLGITECERHVIREQGYSYAQIIYSKVGEGTLILDGETYTIGPNMGFYIPANVPHEYYCSGDGNWSTHWVVMRGSAVDDVFNSLGFDGPRVLKLGNTSRLDKLFNEMYYSITRDNYYGGMYAAANLYSFIIEFFRFSQNHGQSENFDLDAPLNKVLSYIDAHYQENLTLDILCQDAGISPQHLCRLFRKKLNIRPMEYIAKKRIQEAKALLINSPRNIAEISELVGYNNCNYFCITFKKYEGVSPTEYRKTMG